MGKRCYADDYVQHPGGESRISKEEETVMWSRRSIDCTRTVYKPPGLRAPRLKHRSRPLLILKVGRIEASDFYSISESR